MPLPSRLFVPTSLFLAALLVGCSEPSRTASVERKLSVDSSRPVESALEDQPSDSLGVGSGPVDRPPHEPIKQNLLTLEAFSAAADKVLDEMADGYSQLASGETLLLPSAIAQAFQCLPLRPAHLVATFEDRHLVVRRESRRRQGAAAALRAPAGLEQALAQLAEPLAGSTDVRVKFKTFRVENLPTSVSTNVYFHAAGSTSEGIVEQSATWACTWTVPPGSSQPTLQSIELLDYEEVLSRAGPLFEEITESVLEPSGVFQSQLLPGVPAWRARFQAEMGMEMRGHQGLAVGDVDGDGLEDVYLCQPVGLPNRLLIQNPDGTVRDASAAAGVDWLDSSRSALLLDLDNDGDQDLVVAMQGAIAIGENDGSGKFRTAARLAGPEEPRSMAAIDFDGDQRLDLYVCGFWDFPYHDTRELKTIMQVPTPYHDATNGPPNMFYRNEGGWAFRDITDECGLGDNNRRFSHAAAWEDFDQDGDADLYVANDFGRNNLYLRKDDQFVDVAADYGVEDMATSMSVTWADYNHDGWSDIYVSNMFSSAGGRITHQPEFQPRLSAGDRAGFQRHTRGNTLFSAQGGNQFDDVTLAADVAMGRWAWCSQFVDINNDSWDDLFVANGFITNEDTGDL